MIFQGSVEIEWNDGRAYYLTGKNKNKNFVINCMRSFIETNLDEDSIEALNLDEMTDRLEVQPLKVSAMRIIGTIYGTISVNVCVFGFSEEY